MGLVACESFEGRDDGGEAHVVRDTRHLLLVKRVPAAVLSHHHRVAYFIFRLWVHNVYMFVFTLWCMLLVFS